MVQNWSSKLTIRSNLFDCWFLKHSRYIPCSCWHLFCLYCHYIVAKYLFIHKYITYGSRDRSILTLIIWKFLPHGNLIWRNSTPSRKATVITTRLVRINTTIINWVTSVKFKDPVTKVTSDCLANTTYNPDLIGKQFYHYPLPTRKYIISNSTEPTRLYWFSCYFVGRMNLPNVLYFVGIHSIGYSRSASK